MGHSHSKSKIKAEIVKFRGRSVFDTASDFPDKINYNKTLIAGLFSSDPKWLCDAIDSGKLTYDPKSNVAHLVMDDVTGFKQTIRPGDFLTIDDNTIYVI